MHKLATVRLVGRVVSGCGEGRKYLQLNWVQQQISETLGFHPFLGTLNLQLDHESAKLRRQLNANAAMCVCTSEGYRAGLLFKAAIVGMACGVIIPQIENYPDDRLEVVSSLNLRKTLRLSDGDTVEVTVIL